MGGISEFAGQEDSIFILDEPDSHVHINNKEQITNSFIDYVHNRQIIITTHSPTLTQCVKDENVYMLNNGKIEDRNRQAIIEAVTGEFWNKHQQNSFLASKKPIILLVEGKHDKEHITNAYEKLKEEYSDLVFDIYNMTGADNIPQLITGLKTSDLDFKPIIIGIFDNDKAGRDNCNKTEVRYFSSKKHNQQGFYAITYSNNLNPQSGDGFTVENMFAPHHLEKAYTQALNELLGKFENMFIDNISKNIKDKAKSNLSEASKNFSKEDFVKFKELFDLIREIKCLGENKNNVKNAKGTDKKDSPNDDFFLPAISPTTKLSEQVNDLLTFSGSDSSLKISARDNHLAYWTAFKKFVSKQNVSFKLQKPSPQHWTIVAIGSSGFRISILANTQKHYLCIQLIFGGKYALTDFKILQEKYEVDAKQKLSPSLEWKENKGKKEHHLNLVFFDKNPFDKNDWDNQHQLLSDWTEKFYNYFKDKVKVVNPLF
jgi:hypothetical protein